MSRNCSLPYLFISRKSFLGTVSTSTYGLDCSFHPIICSGTRQEISRELTGPTAMALVSNGGGSGVQ